MNPHTQCQCPECNGTGAHKPNCWLCDGDRIIKIEKALSEGYSEEYLEDAYDGECMCPADECRGDSCELCEGDGVVDRQAVEDEVTRVLLCAQSGTLPPRLHRLPYGRIVMEDALLANFAGGVCEDRGWIRWYRSILGDEISLTPAGEIEAKARSWDYARRKDTTLCPIDDLGRLDDDGAPSRPQQEVRQ